MKTARHTLSLCVFFVALSIPVFTQSTSKLELLKQEVAGQVDQMKDVSAQMVDQVFSYGELGFQEFETSRYLTDVLKKNGFQVKEGISGIPTAWVATWGSGKPVIALGSDIDGIPKASQKPGVAYHDPIVAGAPGHGEGHNSGVPLNITAALALKKVMEREKLSGTLMIWPGVAEEVDGAKAYYIRDGYFKDVDICLFAHVGSNLTVTYGPVSGSGLVSVEYTFKGEAAHAAAAPWRGRSALDAVELMDVGWNFRREHLRPQQRSHNVITDGGDQPNVVPSEASVWYFLREVDYAHISEMFETGNTMAQAAAMMTGTTVTHRLLGSAWPGHFNKSVAELTYSNIKSVGLPQWSDADQTLAKGIQREVGSAPSGLAMTINPLPEPIREPQGGGSDDIGDISWNLPTIVLGYPSNIPGLPGHHWANAVSMATPIAHKGVTAGAKVQAMTVLDLLLKPEKIQEAWEYFRSVQTKDQKYTAFITATDKPAIALNADTLARFRPEMRKYYFDSTKYKTYLDQLGIKYPMVRDPVK
jgi:aminobenzoyl-glutamate utilization protein B